MANTLNRKDLLLLLLYLPGATGKVGEPIEGRTRLMKLLYMLQQEAPIGKSFGPKRAYNFQAYHYGPFSKDVYGDLEFLENVDLVEATSQGAASPIDQGEEEKVVDDIAIGEGEEEASLFFQQEQYRLTPHGVEWVQQNLIPQVSAELSASVQELKTKFAPLPLTTLLRYVYSKYPGSAENTKLKYLISA